MQLLSRIAEPLLDLVFPPSCAVCSREGTFLCADCEADLPRLEPPYCRSCSEPGPRSLCEWCRSTSQPFDGITAPYRWAGAVPDMVYSLKYRGVRASAPRLAELLVAHLSTRSIHPDVIVPVPLHRRRERERGFNQSELLAKGIAKRTGMPMETGVLARTRNTAPQVTMKSPEQRRENIAGAFECIGDVAGKRVLLIDDVVTTGATVAACSVPLRDAGASSIWVLSLAR
jgi:ComF family protein